MAEDMTFLPKKEVLTLEELDRLCGAFIALGTEKIRLTGGEPLVRKNVISLFRSLGARIGEGGLKELTVTTNGTQLEKMAGDLFAAGVRRINVSLDSLDPATFSQLTRWGKIEPTLDGIFAAKAAGLQVKINAVAMKGVNEHEFDRMIAWCGEHGFDLCLIETMPMGEITGDRIREGFYTRTNWVPRGFEGVCNPSNFAPDDHRGQLRVGIYRARVSGSTAQGTVAELMRAGTMRIEPVTSIELDRRRDWLGW